MLYAQDKGTYYVQVGIKGHTLTIDILGVGGIQISSSSYSFPC